MATATVAATATEAATVAQTKRDTGLDSPDRSYSLFPSADTSPDTATSSPNQCPFRTNFVQTRIQNYTLPTSLRRYIRYTLRTDTIPCSLNPDFHNFWSWRTAKDRNTNRTEVSRPLACRNSALRRLGARRGHSARLLESLPDPPSAAASTTSATSDPLGKKRRKKHSSELNQKPPPRSQPLLHVFV